jgi:hypothetical protein
VLRLDLAAHLLLLILLRFQFFIEFPVLGIPGIVRFIDVRTQWFDSGVEAAVNDGITQVVIIAAGYDTRAYRLARPGVRFYEIDLPHASKNKQELVKDLLPSSQVSIEYKEAGGAGGHEAGRAVWGQWAGRGGVGLDCCSRCYGARGVGAGSDAQQILLAASKIVPNPILVLIAQPARLSLTPSLCWLLSQQDCP